MGERVEAVVLAAGLSSRCEEYKLTLPWEGQSLIEQTLSGMLPVVERVIVVLGHNDEAVREALRGTPKATCVVNDAYLDGMFSSVRVGLAQVARLAHTSADAVLLQPGDIPLVPTAVYRELLASDASVAIPTYKDSKGHPVLMRREVVEDVLAAPTTDTLRDVLERWGFERVPVDDPAILWDVDTMDDYYTLLARYRQRTQTEE